MPYNLLSCTGPNWTSKAGSYIGGSECIKAKLGIVLLFFIVAILRKWGGEEMGLDFNFLFALILGLGPYLMIVILFGSFKIALVAGLIGSIAGGYGGGLIFGGSEGGY